MNAIIVTGASSGVGRSVVEHLLRIGEFSVVAVSRNAQLLETLKTEMVKHDLGGNLHLFPGDITEEETPRRLRAYCETKKLEVGYLLNNAGVLVAKPITELTTAEWEMVYRTNVFSIATMVKELLPLMERQTLPAGARFRAHIVNIGSIGGVQGSLKFAGLSAYSSSKGAVSVLTECLAEELKDRSIAVNCLALGSVDTEMFRAAFPGLEAGKKAGEMGAYIADFLLKGHAFYNGKVLEVTTTTP